MAKIHEDGDDAAEAFRCYTSANRLMVEHERAGYIRFRQGEQLARAQALLEVFTPEAIDRWGMRGPARRGLTLLLGPPRSGKSLLEGALAAHPAIRAYGERAVVDEVLRRGGEDFYRDYPRSLLAMGSEASARAGELLDAAWGEPVVPGTVTHLLSAPGHYLHAGAIMLLNPASRVVICERDAVETCMAIFMKFFEKAQPYAWEIDTIAEYVAVYRRVLAHWRQVFPERVTYVSYEAMLEDPDGCVAGSLADHGLDWDDACANARAGHISPRQVGFGGSALARVSVTTDFTAMTSFYAPWLPLFSDAVARADERVTARLGCDPFAGGPSL
jgi:hypothetical protein